MKKIYKFFPVALTLVSGFCSTLMAQPYPGGDPGSGTGTGTGPGGAPIAGAPIGDGLLILGILAALYSGKKIYELYLENKEDQNPQIDHDTNHTK
ncbi:MAG TPA: hypothetical protein PLP88_09685 [Bacteroidales bacterium]|nr:hypothetical protein [Bacteroidales bacterium]